jgi:predicted nucleic acid-binding protein
VDSSVWIDYSNDRDISEVAALDRLLETELLGVGDLILAEVLQGFRQEKDYQTAKRLLTFLTVFEMLGAQMAMKSANNFRDLRKKGITVRKTINVMIATFCIENGHKLLFSDKRPPSGIELADRSACAKGDRIKASQQKD